jgi:putative nucleotidyltransferase with HDIG domain
MKDATALHLRTIEALALAIERIDDLAGDHLRRVRLYALEVGRRMGLGAAELEALEYAALLHDVGELAVPQHIISKPGRLTQEEFDKTKIHAAVGAELVERVGFPVPVAPIVRAHHERWDGGGYPDGLRGEQIPLGARILSVVDSLNVLMSNRRHRPARTREEALRLIEAQSGQAFDPAVVRTLMEREKESEWADDPPEAGRAEDYFSAITAARQEAQLLYTLSEELGGSHSLQDKLDVVAAQLKPLIPYDAIAVYLRRDGVLEPAYVAGVDSQLLSALVAPMGHGVSGWAAASRRPVLNGDAAADCAVLEGQASTALASALAVPLENAAGALVGTLTLYHAQPEAFRKEHLRVLLAARAKIAQAIENALRLQRAEQAATVDATTSLPNARALFLHLDAELARCRRNQGTLAVLTCEVRAEEHALKAMAAGLRSACREYDFIARSGDQFVLALSGFTRRDLAEKEKQIQRLVEEAGGESGARVGAAFYPQDGADTEDLLAEAGRRLYVAQQSHEPDAGASLGLRDLGRTLRRAGRALRRKDDDGA